MASKPRYFQNNYYYHCFNRGVDKRDIFLEDRDYMRFLATIETSNDPSSMRTIDPNKKTGKYFVDVINYCLMPNHYHLTLKQVCADGISIFLHRLGTSYTKYFNTKYKRSGRLFEYIFKANEIESDEQLTHLSRYIHLNPFSSQIVDNPQKYRWSSLKYYLGGNPEITCNKEQILALFNHSSYSDFIDDQKNYARKLNQIKHLLLDTAP